MLCDGGLANPVINRPSATGTKGFAPDSGREARLGFWAYLLTMAVWEAGECVSDNGGASTSGVTHLN